MPTGRRRRTEDGLLPGTGLLSGATEMLWGQMGVVLCYPANVYNPERDSEGMNFRDYGLRLNKKVPLDAHVPLFKGTDTPRSGYHRVQIRPRFQEASVKNELKSISHAH